MAKKDLHSLTETTTLADKDKIHFNDGNANQNRKVNTTGLSATMLFNPNNTAIYNTLNTDNKALKFKAINQYFNVGLSYVNIAHGLDETKIVGIFCTYYRTSSDVIVATTYVRPAVHNATDIRINFSVSGLSGRMLLLIAYIE